MLSAPDVPLNGLLGWLRTVMAVGAFLFTIMLLLYMEGRSLLRKSYEGKKLKIRLWLLTTLFVASSVLLVVNVYLYFELAL